MGLYLCVFDEEEDIAGVDVGSYADFNAFRNYIVTKLEGGRAGTKFPTLILHSDSDGEWRTEDCKRLKCEIDELGMRLRDQSPIPFSVDWQINVAKSIGLVPKTAFESFIDADGEPLVERLSDLIDIALQRGRPILFQ